MELEELVTASRRIAESTSRTRRVELLAGVLRDLPADEHDIGLAYLSGEPRQERLDLGPAAVMGIEVPPSPVPALRLAEVDAALQSIADVSAGSGSRRERIERLTKLLAAATDDEQRWLRALVLRELRQGSLEGLLVQAVAAAAAVPVAAVRRAAMLTGSLRATGAAALAGGEAALAAFRLEVGVPLQPMLATTASDLVTAFAGSDAALLDAKLDGARVQVHRDGDLVRVFTRSLKEITHRVPEVVSAVGSLQVSTVVLDGEVLAFDDSGRPLPFQETMRRVGSERDVGAVSTDRSLQVRFFDLLHLDGRDALDAPLRERRAALETVVPAELRVDALQVTAGAGERARAFVASVLAAGHEGVMVKDLDAPYEAGRRGASWRKLKPVHTLDLVVLAAEWGSGRRKGWLSNLHLGVRADDGDGFVMVGKTFKGLTDEMLTWQTEQLLARATRRDGHVVHVRPELVVEIALDGFVRSTRYPGGIALRFARVRGYRPDKPASQADTLAEARAIHRGERPPAT